MNRPYHHGALREALLQEGRRLLVQEGPEKVSLRELARRIGVSHSAPERHFASRQALLDALAADGFASLSRAIREALDSSPGRIEDQFRAAARAYVRFAVDNGPLLDLMFASKADPADEAIAEASRELFSVSAALIGEPGQEAPAAGPGPLRVLVAATLQGIASLVATRRIADEYVDTVIDEAVSVFLPAIARPPGHHGPG